MNFLRSLLYTAISILLFICFEEQIGELLWNLNAAWFGMCNQVAGGILIWFLCGYLVYLLLNEYKSCIFGRHLMAGCMTAFLIYVYYRWIDDRFEFWYIPYLGDVHIAYTDMLLVVSGVAAYIQIKEEIRQRKEMLRDDETTVLSKDDPLRIASDDLLGYRSVAASLVADLEGMWLTNGSFSVGITGEWGMGKSSFFNIMKEELKQHKRCLVYQYNPRSSASIQDIQQDFFDGFANVLAPYHSGVHRVMMKYQAALQIVDNKLFTRLLNAFSSLTSGEGKDYINDIIRSTGKRVYVLIDDLDRLTASEIIEVMKLIDRNAGFVNTVFVTAYDKKYVNDVLKKHLGQNGDTDFSDKYFSYELSLPLQSTVVLSDFAKTLIIKKSLMTRDETMMGDELERQWEEIGSTIVKHLRTLRHIKRYMNIMLSRYVKVKDDVVFKDFALLTLLRYMDINVYHALVEGKLIVQGGALNDNTDKAFYLKKEYETELKDIASWDASKDVLEELFKKMESLDFQVASKYQRLQYVKSFPNYYYDYRPGAIYYKDLIPIYRADTDEEAYDVINKLIGYEESKRQYYKERYESVEDFLTQRPLGVLSSFNDVRRLVRVIIYLLNLIGRNINLEATLSSLLYNWQAERCTNANIVGNEEEYRIEIEDVFVKTIESHPYIMACVLIPLNDDLLAGDADMSGLMFTRHQIAGWAILCQKYYIQQEAKYYTWQEVNTVMMLSKIFIDQERTQVNQSAKAEFISYISNNPDKSANYLCRIRKTQDERPQLIIQYPEGFHPDYFFPHDGITYESWIEDNIKLESLKNIMQALGKSDENRIQLRLRKENFGINVEDYDRVWNLLKSKKEEDTEKILKPIIDNHVALSYAILVKESGLDRDTIKRSIERMVSNGVLKDNYLNLADAIPPFEIGDFVRIKNVKLKDRVMARYTNTYVYKILSMEQDKLELDDIDGDVVLEDVEAIPLDGVHDADIYYDPIVAASIIGPGQAPPIRRTDYTYFMQKFEDCTYDGKSFADYIREKNLHFVHEVQHWLREEFHSDDLKIK